MPSFHQVGLLQLARQPLLSLVVEARQVDSRDGAALGLGLLAVWLRGLSL